MTAEGIRRGERVIERWDRAFGAVSAEPRRQVVVSLMDVPADRSVELPAAATSPTVPANPDRLRIELRHRHLPMLAEAGYVRWEEQPFTARRGPRFEEVSAIMAALHAYADRLPDRLVDGCQRLTIERTGE